ncbi:MAG: hypothetical protein L0Y44_00945 [Phycisphaerales bacterium]|nr:hypothetical protein [Phycisphaerales bacterium]MCI0674447.1 hypothetical protein [Phycisphaerales bacterium]
MRCKTCHYSLKNLTEHRCPECGRAFDPDYPETFAPDPFDVWTKKTRTLVIYSVGFVIGSIPFVILFLILPGSVPTIVGWSIGIALSLSIMFTVHFMRKPKDHKP